jgi:predicted helicase
VDTLTTLRGVPPEAWDYRLGAYSALEWVIDLLCRVCRVSVETMKIIRQMPR